MKWIGQHIYDQISRFRDDVYIENLSTTTETSVLVIDSDGKVSKSTSVAGDLTAVVAGTGLSGTSLSGPIPTLNVDASIPEITTLAGLTSIGAAGAVTNFVAGDVTIYNAVNNGNPYFAIGSVSTESLRISAIYNSGAQTFDSAKFETFSSDTGANEGRYHFHVDGSSILSIKDTGLNLVGSMNLSIGGIDIIADSSGTTTLSNIDALDATTEATVETAIDTLSNLTTTGTIGTGVWDATKILSPKTTHVIHYPFKGYSTGISSGNFQYSVNYQDAQSLFQLNFDYGDTVIADGSLDDVSNWFRSSGTVMPRAVTATRVYGWMTCPTTSNVTIALCKITPTRNDNSAVVPIVVATTVIAAIDNDKMDFFNITTSDAGAGTGSIVTSAIAQGDILMPFVISPNTKTTFFNLMLEVEA